MSGAETAPVPFDDRVALPHHVAMIMDGNGRWARQRGLPRLSGHRAGTENLRRVIDACVDFGIKIVTIYAFSTENWTRPEDEIRGLMSLLSQMLRRELESLRKNGVRLRHLGTMEGLPTELQEGIRHAVKVTAGGERLLLNVALNYGGRMEIVQAIQHMLQDSLPSAEITEQTVGDYLFTRGIPDPDLIIRTAGEMRLSNFLVWQAAYAEFYSTPVYWPDFGPEELQGALAAYSERIRKYGGLLDSSP